jgi:hypothetical protein
MSEVATDALATLVKLKNVHISFTREKGWCVKKTKQDKEGARFEKFEAAYRFALSL